MLYFRGVGDVFRARIFDADFFVEVRMDGDVHRLINRGAHNHTSLTPVEIRQVTASAREADAKWRLRQDHASFSLSALSPAGLPMSKNGS